MSIIQKIYILMIWLSSMADKQMLCPSCGGTPVQKEITDPSGEKKIKKKCMECATTWYDPV